MSCQLCWSPVLQPFAAQRSASALLSAAGVRSLAVYLHPANLTLHPTSLQLVAHFSPPSVLRNKRPPSYSKHATSHGLEGARLFQIHDQPLRQQERRSSCLHLKGGLGLLARCWHYCFHSCCCCCCDLREREGGGRGGKRESRENLIVSSWSTNALLPIRAMPHLSLSRCVPPALPPPATSDRSSPSVRSETDRTGAGAYPSVRVALHFDVCGERKEGKTEIRSCRVPRDEGHRK